MSEGSGRRTVLVLGGVRSGKSHYAQAMAARGTRVAFIATAEAGDEEMQQRIARHRSERPCSWTTLEAPLDLDTAIRQCDGKFDTIVVDCLTVWAANLLEHEQRNIEKALTAVDRVAELLRSVRSSVILVSNEVGSGIVPDNELGRLYRDLLGAVNQRVAAAVDEVVLLVAGCPLVIKQPTEALA